MIKFENTKVFNINGAIRGMRNPMNSWKKSDTASCYDFENCNACTLDSCLECSVEYNPTVIGENDLALAIKLKNAGTDHRKFLRQIFVSVDIIAPLYWWKEFDTYKVGTVANSCSTMHKIAYKPFALNDFSREHIIDKIGYNLLCNLIVVLNEYREKYLNEKDDVKKKRYWWHMIQLLPSSYNQLRTITLNYEVLSNIYHSRKNHKLDEWSIGFMDWIDSLPYAKELLN